MCAIVNISKQEQVIRLLPSSFSQPKNPTRQVQGHSFIIYIYPSPNLLIKQCHEVKRLVIVVIYEKNIKKITARESSEPRNDKVMTSFSYYSLCTKAL